MQTKQPHQNTLTSSSRKGSILLVALLGAALGWLAACQNSPAPVPSGTGSTVSESKSGLPNDGGNLGSSPNDSTDSGSPSQPGSGESATRFLVFGDTGRGDSIQYKVAGTMKTVCEQRGGCQFGLMLGDNFYDSGVSSVIDSQWQSKFEKPYGPLGIPFYPVLGNHDYGNAGNGIDPARAQNEIDYTQKSAQWQMLGSNYAFTKGPISFVALDTQPIAQSDRSASSAYPADQLAVMQQRTQEQLDAVPAQLAQATQPWKIVYGHHPYLSNGPHGNAGRYDGSSGGAGAGTPMKEFVESRLCNQADVYFAGHDHSMQDLGEVCGTQFIVAGAGADTTDITNRNKALFQSTASGFLLGEATASTLTMTFFDENGKQLYSRTLSK
jgi:hypothetical protein